VSCPFALRVSLIADLIKWLLKLRIPLVLKRKEYPFVRSFFRS
jgi:hypothetical protein